ncbi:alpha-ketoglutarate-dependent dioxygenase alkB homolog 7, mitochondrial-like [Ostrinia furnacalis]|uniref:alpha-ketoglutarate-dependent dioxygenase alkB homolog 7, mitochondrial-like n=1 Tax=Ostrinia furnacalis TaxID=93504 RepID=UPI0010390EFE|nr:alpha-ketoglutarate-dependent dioxygenase alkB homolog 7, mitochondrial-like [Ostrinia furnacalis]
MCLLTLSRLGGFKIRPICYHISKTFSSDNVQAKINTQKLSGDPSLIEVLPSWKADEEPELRAAVLRDMQVLPDFVSEAEEAALLAELEPALKRMRYEFDHWDNAVRFFQESENDSVACCGQFCGGVIAGLCLASDAVMRLRHAARDHLALDALIARRCLYVMRYTIVCSAST